MQLSFFENDFVAYIKQSCCFFFPPKTRNDTSLLAETFYLLILKTAARVIVLPLGEVLGKSRR